MDRRNPGRMPASLLMMAGKPKLPESRKYPAKKANGKETTQEKSSTAIGGKPHVHPKLRSEESRRRRTQIWRRH